ncbi:sugar efflux transporter B [Rahnella aquatilis HX2]|nr:sugar efflux transporter B [Rahnella aquatilis HX2]
MTSTAFLIIAFLTGIAGALQTPTLSLFLTSQVHVSPFMVGIFFTGSAVIGIFVSQLLATWSDQRGDRKTLILYCCILGALACVLFAFNRNYFILLFIGVLLSSFGSTANPQMFALAREHSEKTGREAVMFSSILRAQVSLAWVVGPPLAFALSMGFGFTFMYCAATLAFLLCGVMVWMFLPSMPKAHIKTTATLEAPRRNRRDTLMLFIACSLMWAANSIYLINMPLYVVRELGLPEKLAGVLMGSAACLEIPTMLIAGYLAKQLGKRFLMRFAVLAGVIFLRRHSVYYRCGNADCFTVAERNFHRHSGRDRHAVFPGSDAGSGRRGHHVIYQFNAGGLDPGRFAGRGDRPVLDIPCGILCRTGDGDWFGVMYLECEKRR